EGLRRNPQDPVVKHVQDIDAGQAAARMAGARVDDGLQDLPPIHDRLQAEFMIGRDLLLIRHRNDHLSPWPSSKSSPKRWAASPSCRSGAARSVTGSMRSSTRFIARIARMLLRAASTASSRNGNWSRSTGPCQLIRRSV